LSLGGGDEHESAPSRQHPAESHRDASRPAAVSANFDETEAVADAGPSSVAEHELPVAQSVDIPQNDPIASLVPTRSRGFRTVTSVVAVAAVALAIGLSAGLTSRNLSPLDTENYLFHFIRSDDYDAALPGPRCCASHYHTTDGIHFTRLTVSSTVLY
jgi:hypothetical protein